MSVYPFRTTVPLKAASEYSSPDPYGKLRFCYCLWRTITYSIPYSIPYVTETHRSFTPGHKMLISPWVNQLSEIGLASIPPSGK